ncbi:lysine-specific permease [Gorgonomyces haynaldii]|nr:lysine-specific permease [Gorgonomyces haynaldii]
MMGRDTLRVMTTYERLDDPDAIPMQRLDVEETDLHRNLNASHLQMIAIGGTIGTGLFLGSGHALQTAGPAGSLAAFSIVGVFVYFVVASLGEMATLLPVTGSFNEYARRFVDPALGFSMGVNYWLGWAITLPIEMQAVSLAMRYWSNAPGWIWSALTLLVCTVVNLFGVRHFGDAEYVFSMTKIVAILFFIFIGIVTIIRLGLGFGTWRVGQAPFVGGFAGLFDVFLTAFFSYGGTELVGITAAEAKNPSATVPKAINGTFWRILIFYTGAIFVMGLILPYNAPALGQNGVSASPFTLALIKAQVPMADHLLNFVVIVAVLSAGNSSMYASSRTLMALAKQGQAPHIFTQTVKGVPVYAMAVSFLIAFISLLFSGFGADVIFNWLLHLTGFSTLLSWMCICIIHLRFRKAYVQQGFNVSALVYKAPFFPYGTYIAIFGSLCVLFGAGISLAAQRAPFVEYLKLYMGVPLFPGLYLWYKIRNKTKLVPLSECNFQH